MQYAVESVVLRQYIPMLHQTRSVRKLFQYPLFVPGIITFFITHEYSRYVGLVPYVDLFVYFLICVSITTICFFILNLVFKSYQRSGIYISFFLVFYFFFREIQELLSGVPLFSRYSVLIVLFISGAIFLFRYLRKGTKDFSRITAYLNALLLILIIYDLFNILSATQSRISVSNQPVISVNATQIVTRPDIYLIILDGYAGQSSLKSHFSYDNSAFLNSLRKKSFFVASNSFSNYTATPVSMASMYSMDYIDWAKKEKDIKVEMYGTSEKIIANSMTLNFLKKEGYDFFNYSIFNIGNDFSQFDPDLLPTKLKLVTAGTFYNKFRKDVFASVRAGIGARIGWLGRYFQNQYLYGNRRLVNLTINIAKSKAVKPKLVYTHLFMPHWPYLQDSLGRLTKYNAFKTIDDKQGKELYLSYLKYTSHYATTIVDELLHLTKGKAVIMVMSDHGFRRFLNDTTLAANNNLNAVYLPEKNYKSFYDSVSNVNQFRLVFNSVFNTQLPLKEDSVVF